MTTRTAAKKAAPKKAPAKKTAAKKAPAKKAPATKPTVNAAPPVHGKVPVGGTMTGRVSSSTPNTEEVPTLSIPGVLLSEIPESAALLDTMRRLRAEIASMTSLMKTREGMGSVAVARSYVVLHHLNACLDTVVKDFATLFNRFKSEVVPASFEEDGITHVPLAEGYRVGVNTRFQVSIRAGMKEDAYDWLRDNELGSLITDTVNASTLSAAGKSLLEEQGKELPDSLFNIALLPGASVTKTKAKK